MSKVWLTPDGGKTVFLPIARCGSTALITSLRRKMGLSLAKPLVSNHGNSVCLSHEDFGMWMHRLPKHAKICVVVRDPIKRLISAHSLWQWKFPNPEAHTYERMLEQAERGSTEHHVVKQSSLLKKLKGLDYTILKLEDADEWSSEYGFRMERIAHSPDRMGKHVPLTKSQEQAAREVYAEDIKQLGY